MATYQLLSSSSTSSSYQSLQATGPVQQRKALSFAILILLVATATLITIIRFTVNPNLNGQTFVQPTNAFALQRAHQLAAVRAQQNPNNNDNNNNNNDNNNQNNQLPSDYESNEQQHDKQVNYAGKLLSSPIVANKSNLINLLPSSLLNNNNGINSLLSGDTKNSIQNNAGSFVQPEFVSPSSKSVTSLIADQRFEKDYRDDPTTISSIASVGKVKRPKPKVIFDRFDLMETERMRIDKEDGCGEDYGAYADFLVLVNSAVFNFDARAAIRETWGKFAVERGAFLYFLLGSTEEPHVQHRVEMEDSKYGDILQGAFYDDYYNLTLKTITMMRWVSEKCYKIRYVLKVDDDMMINMQHACDFTEINPNFHRVIIGKLAKKWKPHRSKLSKWYVPYEAYNQTYYPNFVTGPAYFFTGDAAKLLYETSVNKTVPFYLEDVYMTGIVAERAGIKRFNHAMMRNVHLKLDSCTFPRIMTSHKHKPNEIREIWKQIYYNGSKCLRNQPIVRTTPKAKTLLQRTNININNNNNNNNKQAIMAKKPLS